MSKLQVNNEVVQVDVIPALPGFREIYEYINDNGTTIFELGEPIIGWRIETSILHPVGSRREEGLYTIVDPITSEGGALSNAIGCQNPDGSVSRYGLDSYHSLKELQETVTLEENKKKDFLPG